MGSGHPFFHRDQPRAYHHGRLREALLEAARVLVAERGPAGFTLADAAKLAGVSAAAPYRHFVDRSALLTELTRRGFELFGDRLEDAWADGAPDPGAALARMSGAYLDFARQERGLYAAMFASVTTLDAPEAGAAATRALDLLRRAAAALLRVRMAAGCEAPPAEAAKGDAPKGDARGLAFEIWALSHGVAMLAVAGHLDVAFEGGDPAAILSRATSGLVDAAVRRACAKTTGP